MKTAVVTGATGLLGANLAAELHAAGWRVRCTRRASSDTSLLADVPVEWVEAGLRQEELARAFSGADVVFHNAASTELRSTPTPAMVATNVDGAVAAVLAARQAGVARVVHCSSVVAVGLSDDGRPCTEDSPWNMPQRGVDDGYVTTKRRAEEAVLMAGAQQDVVVVNPAFMLGPRDARPSSGRLLLELIQGRMVVAPGGENSFVDVRDVARGMILAAERGVRGRRYILAGENLPYREAFQRMARIAGVMAPSFTPPLWVLAPLGWAGDAYEKLADKEPLVGTKILRWGWVIGQRFSSERAERELGWSRGPWERGVEDALAWFRANGRL